jgi:hypothetical protein
MIGLRPLSNNRRELYASHVPLETLKPYLLHFYREAYATIVLYEDNIEVFHETGIFSFDASEPETFNYEEFRAPLIEEFHDRLAICTVENLFLHLERFVEEKPMEDDPFHNLVFSISLAPPSRELLLDWEKNINKRLRRVLYDYKSTEHFQLFPNEVCVVYSHGNYFTSVTSNHEALLEAIFEDIVKRYLGPLTTAPIPKSVIDALYWHTQTYDCIRFKPDRLHKDAEGKPFLLMTYPKREKLKQKPFAKIFLDVAGTPTSVSEQEFLLRLVYHLRYTDPTFLPMILIAALMCIVIAASLYFRIFGPSHHLLESANYTSI